MSEWWAALTALERGFVWVAFPFTLLTVLQVILEIIGVGGDSGHADTGIGDFAHDSGFMDHFHFFSVRNMIYFMMMFGWTGLACSKAGLPTFVSVFIAVLAGIGTTLIIGWIFYLLNRLTESGNLNLNSAIGKMGTVYLTIPANRKSNGVIQITLQGMMREMNAVTDNEEIATGASVEVIELLQETTFLVNKAEY